MLLLVNPNLAVKRDVLLGIEGEVTARGWQWRLEYLPHLAERKEWSLPGPVDGVIAWPDNGEQLTFLSGLTTTMAVVSLGHLRAEGVPRAGFDNAAIGRQVADVLLEKGLRHFAVYGERFQYGYAVERAEGFAKRVEAAGCQAKKLAVPSGDFSGGQLEATLERVVGWLRGLPKPVGILADRDGSGLNLLLACRLSGLRVPDEVAVVAVGADDVTCSLARPRLSAVALPGRRVGVEAARMLAERLGGRRPVDVVFDRFELREEASSEVEVRRDAVVGTALAWIRDRAHEDLGVEAVARAAGVSRRMLELRFKRETGRTVHAEITRVRVERARRLLARTTLGLAEIAERCGYAEPQRLAEAFGRLMGCTPGAYRREVAGRGEPGS